MGAYVTATAILDIVPGLPQTSTAAGYTSTVAVISAHLTRAEALVNGKLAGRYVTPLPASSLPPIIRTVTEDITSFYVFRSFYTQDNQNYNNYLDSYKESMSYLDEIRNGKVDLADTSGALLAEREATQDAEISSNVYGRQSFFDVDSSTSWDFNADLTDEVRGKR